MNDSLHAQAVQLLLQRAATAPEVAAGLVRKSYNARRREATAELRPVLTQVWEALGRGESVGGFTTKEAWAAGQSIKIRQIQKIIAGKPQKAYSVRLQVGMVVEVDGVELTLTDRHLSFMFDGSEL